MSVEIVRVLLGAGVSEREVEAVLVSATSAGKSLAKTLVDQGSPLFDPLDRELTRRELPSIEIVRPAFDEVALLPLNLCERLGVVPVRRDTRTGRVDVAALDPLDPHVIEELEFHLGARVRVLRARPEAIQAALSAGSSSARLPSGPPLPLVRKPSRTESSALGALRPPAAGVASATIHEAIDSAVRAESGTATRADDDGEPVLSLSRAKVLQAPSVPPALAQKPAPLPPAEALSDVLLSLEAAEAPEAVVALLIRGMSPARTLVLAVRAGAYEGRSASLGLSDEAARKVRLVATEPSVVEMAVRSGLYLGALPQTPVHATLRELFDEDSEVYVVPVNASGRASLVLVTELGEYDPSVDWTRRADQLATAAGSALTNILRNKKRR